MSTYIVILLLCVSHFIVDKHAF